MVDERTRMQLDDEGFAVLDAVISDDRRRALLSRVRALLAEEGDAAGSEFLVESGADRLANLAAKGEEFLAVATEPRVLDAVRAVLGAGIKLSSLNARAVSPMSGEVQPLHCDMAAVPDADGFWVCNTVWLLDPFTADNGAIRLVPRSHRTGALPADVLEDPRAPHPDEILVTAPAGSVVVMNAHLWHGGTANRSAASRTVLHAFYCRRDKPQQQYQKGLIDPSVAAAFAPEVRELLALDDPENDRLSGDPGPRSGFMTAPRRAAEPRRP